MRKPNGVSTERTKRKEACLHLPKRGNEIQSAFIDQVVEQVGSVASRIRRVEVAEERGSELSKKVKEDLDEGMKMINFAD